MYVILLSTILINSVIFVSGNPGTVNCTTDAHCGEHQKCSKDEFCKCINPYVFNKIVHKCVKPIPLNGNCTTTLECNWTGSPTDGMVCRKGRCQCEDGYEEGPKYCSEKLKKTTPKFEEDLSNVTQSLRNDTGFENSMNSTIANNSTLLNTTMIGNHSIPATNSTNGTHLRHENSTRLNQSHHLHHSHRKHHNTGHNKHHNRTSAFNAADKIIFKTILLIVSLLIVSRM